MPLRFSIREHESSGSFLPVYIFSKFTATILRQYSTPNGSIGNGYFFIVCDRAWLDGKWLRWRWGCDGSTMNQVANVEIYDGEYDRSSDVDFPPGASLLLKGNGLLQLVRQQWAYGFDDIEDWVLDTSGGVEDKCTLVFRLRDSWGAENFWLNLDWVQFNTGSGGAGTLYDEQFTDGITMERTGGYGDYGYISTGELPYQEDSANLAGGFRVRQENLNLPAKFHSFLVNDSADLTASMHVGLFAEFLGKFRARHAVGDPSTMRFSLREHDYTGSYSPVITFPKLSSSEVAIQSGTGGGRGDGYAFINVPRAWLNGKYLRFSSRSNVFWSFIAAVYIYDGSYDRTSNADFPTNLPLLLKGNGLLQTIFSTSSSFGWTTRDTQVNVAAGSEENCMICFYLRENQNFGDYIWHRIDWFEINDSPGGVDNLYNEPFDASVVMEKTGSFGDYGYISTGEVIPLELLNLPAKFDSGQNSVNLPAKLDSGQDSASLQAGFMVLASESKELPTSFSIRHTTSSDLLAHMGVTWLGDLGGAFRVEKILDLRGTAGIAFYWWGADNPPEGLNQIRLETPTGFWWSDFYDGTAKLRYVFIPWGSFTWVPAKQRRLEPHHYGFNEPTKNLIDTFLFTIHTAGVRRVDYIHAPFMRPFLGKFTVRQPGSADFLAGFAIASTGTPQNLSAGFAIRRPASQNLSSGFFVNQGIEELPSAFDLSTLEISLRELYTYGALEAPNWTFSKPDPSILRATSTTSAQGRAYIFLTISKEYIHNKYLRITWQGDYTWATWGSRVYVYDGSYDRQSELDFNPSLGLLLKGNGLLQTGLSHAGDFGPVTEEFQVDVSGSALENVTIMIFSSDSWVAQSGWIQVDLLEINSAAAGVGTLWREPFNGDITMERLGSTGDYGYIGVGRPPLGAVQDLAAGFTIRQLNLDLPASFDAQVSLNLPAEFITRQPASADLLGGFLLRQDIKDLPAELTVRQAASADLLGTINVVHSTDLPAELTVRQPASADLLAGFLIRQETEDLAAELIVRQPASQNLLGEFVSRQAGSQDLLGEFSVRRDGSQDLLAGFFIRQETEDLPAKFTIRQDVEDLLATFTLPEFEGFEDAILLDNYQLYSGNGFRDTAIKRTGSYSWRTRQGEIDIFDVSNGKTLSYFKIEPWTRYGNGTLKIELLDSSFATLAQTTWSDTSTWTLRPVEFTGPVKYVRITCPGGSNSGLWTDDILITFT